MKEYAWNKFGLHDARSVAAHDAGSPVREWAHYAVASFWLSVWRAVR